MTSGLTPVTLIDNATGEPPQELAEGDQIVVLGAPKQVMTEWRQLIEVRRALPIVQAEMAVYDAIETLRGRVEVVGLADKGTGSVRIKAQRLRQAGRVLTATVNDLAQAVEGRRK